MDIEKRKERNFWTEFC